MGVPDERPLNRLEIRLFRVECQRHRSPSGGNYSLILTPSAPVRTPFMVEGRSGETSSGAGASSVGGGPRPSWPTEVGFGVVRPMTTSNAAGSIRMMAIGFHHSSIAQVTR